MTQPTFTIHPFALRVHKRWRKAIGLGPERPGALVRLRDADGIIGWGEVSPLASVHGPKRDDWLLSAVLAPLDDVDVAALATISDWSDACAWLDTQPTLAHPSLRFGLEMAWLGLHAQREHTTPAAILAASPRALVDVQHLCTATVDAVEQLLPHLSDGDTVKLKVGRARANQEARAIELLLSQSSARLRLDANRAWSLDDAIDRLRNVPWSRVDYVEEPLAQPDQIDALVDATDARIAWDETRREREHEALHHHPAVRAWIVKPQAVGGDHGLRALDASRGDHDIALVLSSCLETGMGLAHQAQLAAAHACVAFPAGLGTQHVYRSDPIGAAHAPSPHGYEIASWQPQPDDAWLQSRARARELTSRIGARGGRGVRSHRDPFSMMGPRDVVAIASTPVERAVARLARLARRGPDAPVALLVDALWPAARMEAVLEQAGASWIWHDEALIARDGGRPCPVVEGDDVAVLLATSGTTSTGRIIAHGHRGLLASSEGAVDALGLSPDDRWLLALPVHHVGGLSIVWRCALARATWCLPEEGEALHDAIARNHATRLSIVPTQLARLLDREPCPSLTTVLVGGAPLPVSLAERAAARDLPIVNVYGSTETAAFVAMDGRPLPGRELALHDVDAHGVGTVFIRSPSMALGTLSEGTITPLVDDDDWLATSDRATWIDERLTIVGRADRVFISGGENVQPERIEAALLAIDGIEVAAVVPVEDATWGSRPVAYVDGPAVPEASRIEASLRDALARHEQPMALVRLPKRYQDGVKVALRQLTEDLAEGMTLRPLA